MKPGSSRLLLLATLAILVPACGVSGGGTLTPTAAPRVPTGLSPSSGNRSVTLTWDPSPAATQYTIRRSASGGGPYAAVPGAVGVAGSSFTDSNLTNGTTYYYVVSAANAFGESENSAAVAAAPGLKARALAAGISHTLAVLQDGSLWSWGRNIYGILGIGTEGDVGGGGADGVSTVAVPVLGLSKDVKAAAAGMNHSLALKTDGTVWVWGLNTSGQLGDGTALDHRTVPYQLPGLTDITDIAAGWNHSLALRRDGTVLAWGENVSGQAGSPGGAYQYTPFPVPGLTDIRAISGGRTHSLALRNDGTVWGWGSNLKGELSTLPAGPTPGRIINLTNVTAIHAGMGVSMAVTQDGSAWGWGSNNFSVLGMAASVAAVDSPHQVSGITGVRTVGCGQEYAMALRTDGTVWTWGTNTYSQFGNGALNPPASTVPVQVPGLSSISSIVPGDYNLFAISEDGSIWGWGNTGSSQVGNGTGVSQHQPVPVANLNGVASVRGGLSGSVALRTDGTVWSWGPNTVGQLGNGVLSPNVLTPVDYRVQVVTSSGPLAGVVRLSTGCTSRHTLAILGNGTVMAWGMNDHGQVGNNTTTDSPIAVPVSGLASVIRVASGWDHSLALLSDGTVQAWGNNIAGQLGINSTTETHVPVPIPGLSGVTEIAAGNGVSIARLNDGTVLSWGTNMFGQLGVTGMTESPVPVPVTTLSGITAVSIGLYHCLAVKDDGTVWTWGANPQQQLGQPGVPQTDIPLQVPTVTEVVAAGAGFFHSEVLKTDGSIWAWGSNTSGQLGGSPLSQSGTPFHCQGVTGPQSISVAANHTLALMPDGTVLAWGDNAVGEIGIGTHSIVPTPIQVTR